MSWDQVRELKAAGVEIGSHTMNHIHMGRVDRAEAEREVSGSCARLEAELGAWPEHFAYPYGSRDHINAANHQVIRRAGFLSCFSAYGGLVSKGDDPLAIQRMPISTWYRSPSQFLTELVVEAIRPSQVPARFPA
jgi:peptidoglycan/xylan/chitin deacetylase (PgdA/CDA1 family)